MKQKYLEKYYRQMTKRFYLVDGVDDPNLKQVFISSIPDVLAKETFRFLSTSRKTLQNTTLGEIFQIVLQAMEKMCSHNTFIQEYMKQTKKLDNVCNHKELHIKCPSHTYCSCSTKFKKHKKYKRYNNYDRSSKSSKFKQRFNSKKRPWRFL